jgi:NADH-ubiquinone oxidoreductase chain 1
MKIIVTAFYNFCVFLGEYCSIVLMSTLSATLFLGGWGMPELFINSTPLSISSLVLALKACAGCFGFVWFRATLPRLRCLPYIFR